MTKYRTPPAEMLKRIRARTNVTAMECARELKKVRPGKTGSEASPNSWYRWESVEKVQRTALPDDVIAVAIKLLVGKGSPPVTADELLALTASQMMLNVRASARATGAIPARHTNIVEPFFDDVQAEPMAVRYRAEKGLFMHKSKLLKRTYGISPISAARDIKGEQFSALVAEGPEAGMVLHCVVPSVYSKAQLQGRRVVVVREDDRQKDMVEVIVGRVEGATGNRVKMVDAAGDALDGDIYGVVIGSYTRE